MVQAMKGVLLQGDVTMIEYVKSVNRGLPQNEKFIIADLDDKTLLLQPEAQELIQTKAVQMDKVGINQFLKASIDIIRLAANPKATWSAESIRNAVSWLEKTEAWAKQEHINKDEVHDLMRELSPVLPNGEELAFEHLISAKEVFVKHLLLRPCKYEDFLDTSDQLQSVDCNKIQESRAYYARKVSCASSQLQVARCLLSQIGEDIGSGKKSAGGQASWESFVCYLLSWRIVCLSSILSLDLKQEPSKQRIVKALVNPWNEGGEGGQSKPLPSSVNSLECCCILLLAPIWYGIINAAHNKMFVDSGSSSGLEGDGAVPKEIRALLLKRMSASLSQPGGQSEVHPALLATAAIHYKEEFLPAYQEWVARADEAWPQKEDYSRWLDAALVKRRGN